MALQKFALLDLEHCMYLHRISVISTLCSGDVLSPFFRKNPWNQRILYIVECFHEIFSSESKIPYFRTCDLIALNLLILNCFGYGLWKKKNFVIFPHFHLAQYCGRGEFLFALIWRKNCNLVSKIRLIGWLHENTYFKCLVFCLVFTVLVIRVPTLRILIAVYARLFILGQKSSLHALIRSLHDYHTEKSSFPMAKISHFLVFYSNKNLKNFNPTC